MKAQLVDLLELRRGQSDEWHGELSEPEPAIDKAAEVEVFTLISALGAAPHGELPDALARMRLEWLIRQGALDGLCGPLGLPWHVFAWARTSRDLDPRPDLRALAGNATADETACADRGAGRHLYAGDEY